MRIHICTVREYLRRTYVQWYKKKARFSIYMYAQELHFLKKRYTWLNGKLANEKKA